MQSWTAALFLAVVTAAPACAENRPLCADLRSLAALAATGEVVRISLSNAVGGDTVIECGPTNGELRLKFCESVLAPAGMHGMQSYSRRIYDCVRASGVRPFTVPAPGRRAVLLRIASVADLRRDFNALHPLLCQIYGRPRAPNDFEAALSTLEGGFLMIHNGQVSFINPSVRDFLKGELTDPALLAACAGAATTVAWAAEVWRQALGVPLSHGDLTDLLGAATQSLPLFTTRGTQVFRKGVLQSVDLPLGRRLALLADWWGRTDVLLFAETMTALATDPPAGFNDADKDELLDLIVQIRSRDLAGFPFPELADVLEGHLEAAFLTVSTDELSSLGEALDQSASYLTQTAYRALANAIDQEFDSLRDVLRDIRSDVQALEEHKTMLREIAPRGHIAPERLARALEAIDEQLAMAEDYPVRRGAPRPAQTPVDPFGDEELASLFSSLRR